MRNICIYLLLLFSATSFGQVNLVPNPSFEDTVICPDNVSQIDRAVGWSSYRISPDYYNTCDLNPLFGVPSNFYGGFQYPATGNAYAGFCGYFNNSVFHEALGIQLNQPLQIGYRYYASMKVSRGSGYYEQHCAGCNKLGIKFTTQQYNFLTNQIPLDNVAQVYTDSIIMDTINWITVGGYFCADSNYQYVSFGNFFQDIYTSTAGNCTTPLWGAYYFIDDVQVIEDTLCSVASIPNINLEPVVKVYPNPSVEGFYVECNYPKNVKVKLSNPLGEVILVQYLTNQKTRIETSEIPNGLYLIQFSNYNILLNKTILIKH